LPKLDNTLSPSKNNHQQLSQIPLPAQWFSGLNLPEKGAITELKIIQPASGHYFC